LQRGGRKSREWWLQETQFWRDGTSTIASRKESPPIQLVKLSKIWGGEEKEGRSKGETRTAKENVSDRGQRNAKGGPEGKQGVSGAGREEKRKTGRGKGVLLGGAAGRTRRKGGEVSGKNVPEGSKQRWGMHINERESQGKIHQHEGGKRKR